MGSASRPPTSSSQELSAAAAINEAGSMQGRTASWIRIQSSSLGARRASTADCGRFRRASRRRSASTVTPGPRADHFVEPAIGRERRQRGFAAAESRRQPLDAVREHRLAVEHPVLLGRVAAKTAAIPRRGNQREVAHLEAKYGIAGRVRTANARNAGAAATRRSACRYAWRIPIHFFSGRRCAAAGSPP